jgi:hypothetical protein
MRLKSQGNIDKDAQLPEGIEFRQDLIWDQIQKEQPRKRPVFWWVAAACLLVGIAFLFYPRAEEESVILPIIAQNNTLKPKVNVVPKVISEIEGLQKLEIKVVDIEERELVSPLIVEKEFLIFKDSLPEFELPFGDSQKTIKPMVTIVPILQAKADQELSPAALRLQKSLQKMDPNKVSNQTLVVEKFNLLKELTTYHVQSASGAQLPNSIFQLPKKNRNENN